MRKILNTLIDILLIVCIAVGGWYGWHIYSGMQDADHDQAVVDDIADQVAAANQLDSDTADDRFSHAAWNALYERNQVLVAYMAFDSGLFAYPVVQHGDNDYWLRRNYDGEYSAMGTPFMEANDTLDDMNVTVYGHNVFYDSGAMFSPLQTLNDQETYEKNSTITVWTRDEKRSYGICYLYYIDVDATPYNYRVASVPESAFDEFMEYPRAHNEISSLYGDLEYGDHWLTLQTCKKHNSPWRIIVVAKLLDSEPY